MDATKRRLWNSSVSARFKRIFSELIHNWENTQNLLRQSLPLLTWQPPNIVLLQHNSEMHGGQQRNRTENRHKQGRHTFGRMFYK
jgi:hypothetical protein